MVSLWNARSYLKELKTNLNSSQRAPAFLLPRLTPLHYKFFAQSPPSARASAPYSYATHAAQGLQDSGHHSSHWPDSPAQRPDGATTLKWRLTTNRGWRPNVHLCSFADSRLKKKKKKKIPFSYHQIYGGFRSVQKRPLRKYARICTLTADSCCFKAETNTTL